MMQPGRYDIGADRWVACIRTFTFVGVDFSAGFLISAQVRLTPDAPGSPLINLNAVSTLSSEGVSLGYAGSATVTAHIAAGRLSAVPAGMVASDTVALSVLNMRINETTMESLPLPAERGGNVVLAWDMHITPSGGIKDKYMGGDFIIRSGVTA